MRKRIYRSDTAVGEGRPRPLGRGLPSRVGPGEEGAAAHQRPSVLLAAAGVRPSKGRGQNFLVQPAIAERIVAMAELTREDEVIEIGPGLGILTERILAHPFRALRLVELDSRLASRLRERLGGAPNLEIIEADVLKFDLAGAIERSPVKILGNLPFNVAAAVLRKLSDYRQLISRMVLMFQREVADRIRAKPDEPDYAALSVYTALDWEIERHFRVDAGSFHPRPKVDAEVLVFAARVNPLCEAAEREQVLEVIRAGFSSPRKMVRNNLAAALDLPAQQVKAALERASIGAGARAEALSVLDFVRLARCLERDREMGD